MKINESQRVNGINPYRRTGDAKTTGGDGKKVKTRDEVQISQEAKELLENRVSDPRIEELKQSVNTGNYQVDARKLAEKLLPYIR